MVEQEIARLIAQHFVQRRPRRRRVERRVEQLLDPCGIQVFRRAIPAYCAPARRCLRSRAAAAAASARTAISRVIVLHSAGARRARASRATFRRPATRPRRTRNRAGRRAAHAIWPRRFRRARSAKARPRAASRRRRGRAKARPSTARSARAGPRARPRLRRRRKRAWPAHSAVAQTRTKNAPAISNNAVAAAAKRRAVNTGIPFPGGGNHIAKALAESWQTRRSGDASFAPLGPAPRAVRPAIFACDDQSGGGLGRGGFGPKARAVSRCGRLVLDRASCRAYSFSPSSLYCGFVSDARKATRSSISGSVSASG